MTLTHKERIRLALKHKEADRTPRDFAAEPAVWTELLKHLNLSTKEQVLQYLDIDIRTISYDQVVFITKPCDTLADKNKQGTWKKINSDNTYSDIWGAKRKTVRNEFATYEELCEYPLAKIETIEDLNKYDWPTTNDWDFSKLNSFIDSVNPKDEYALRFRVGSIFETAWSLCGFDTFLEMLILRTELANKVLEKVAQIHAANLRRVLDIAGDRIDIVYSYDDLAHQGGLLISPDLWAKIIGQYQAKIFGMARQFGKETMYHCCGDVCGLIAGLIKIGVTILNPIQPSAISMDFQTLKRQFGKDLTFHGGIDIQHLLPHGNPDDVRAAVKETVEILGKNGGYILSPAHHIQADTPVANILALYGC